MCQYSILVGQGVVSLYVYIFIYVLILMRTYTHTWYPYHAIPIDPCVSISKLARDN